MARQTGADAEVNGTGPSGSDLAVLVLSTDGFSDCWDPFFDLYERYWNPKRYPVYLSTDTKSYSRVSSELTVITTGLDSQGNRHPWGYSLLSTLDKVPEPYVLPMLEDFFINGEVDVALIERCLAVIEGDPACASITLTDHDVLNMRRSIGSEWPFLRRLERRVLYRVDTSPAIWRKSTLRSYVEEGFSIWEFEKKGTQRSWETNDEFLTVAGKKEGAIPYFRTGFVNTGIVKGRWQREVVDFFRKEGINVDYSERGFHQQRRLRWWVKRAMRPLYVKMLLMRALWKRCWRKWFRGLEEGRVDGG